jgi:hypothetical protein
MRKIVLITGKATLFILVMGVFTWVTGNPFIFPSLGPTAYILAFDQQISHSARVVIGGHGCRIIGGLSANWIIVHPNDLLLLAEPFSSTGALLGAGAVLSIAITIF